MAFGFRNDLCCNFSSFDGKHWYRTYLDCFDGKRVIGCYYSELDRHRDEDLNREAAQLAKTRELWVNEKKGVWIDGVRR